MIFFYFSRGIAPYLATISAANRLIPSSFEKQNGKSDPESNVRLFVGIYVREINMGSARQGSSGLGSIALGSAGLDCAGLGSTGMDSSGLCLAVLGWARLEQNQQARLGLG